MLAIGDRPTRQQFTCEICRDTVLVVRLRDTMHHQKVAVIHLGDDGLINFLAALDDKVTGRTE